MLLLFFFSFLFSAPSAGAESFFLESRALRPADSLPAGAWTKPRPFGLYLKPFPVVYNDEVRRWIDFFRLKKPGYIKLWLKRSYRYFPLMEKILENRGLPKELAAMTLIESGLSPRALSPAAAYGYWQFIKPTGLEFGLQINHWIDERRDFQKSTQAAARYLYRLYEEFEDWLLSMSAYNMGERRLRALIKKHQTADFWRLYKKKDFPKETALYVPKVLAAAHIIRSPERYGLSGFKILMPYQYDIFFIQGGLDLKKMSLEAEISWPALQSLNPGLKRAFIPSSVSAHPLRVPKGEGFKISRWLDKRLKKP